MRANASLGELRRDKEKLSLPISCEFVRVKADSLFVLLVNVSYFADQNTNSQCGIFKTL